MSFLPLRRRATTGTTPWSAWSSTNGDQRIQVAKLNLTVPAPRDLDAEVEITVDENKVEVAETE